MAVRLVEGNDPVLHQETKDYNPSELTEIGTLIEDMFNLLESTGGIGLAAPQVGVDRSVFVISIDGIKKVFINPAILSTNGIMSEQEEGCLSLPGLKLKITRPTDITVTWLDVNGTQQIADMQGLWARCWLHEYDHLRGITIEDRVSRLALDIAKRKQLKAARLNRR